MPSEQFRYKDRDYVIEFLAQHPLYAGMWGVRSAESVDYSIVRTDPQQACKDVIRDIDSLDAALNAGFEAYFNHREGNP
ncbi:hypothetical protein [Streptomyces luteogriseus]|uniref:hypothetical protein n=1 Tax=Streptomyces luteogriseus TaxID=68233 RepID=UPI0037A1F2CA